MRGKARCTLLPPPNSTPPISRGSADERKGAMQPPAARIEVVQDTYFGTTIDDPYRWLEDWQSDEARAWVAAQGAYARAYLDALPAREALLARIAELSAGEPALFNFQIAGGRFFYRRRDPGDQVPKLVVRQGLDGAETVLLDPNAPAPELAADGPEHTEQAEH